MRKSREEWPPAASAIRLVCSKSQLQWEWCSVRVAVSAGHRNTTDPWQSPLWSRDRWRQLAAPGPHLVAEAAHED